MAKYSSTGSSNQQLKRLPLYFIKHFNEERNGGTYARTLGEGRQLSKIHSPTGTTHAWRGELRGELRGSQAGDDAE